MLSAKDVEQELSLFFTGKEVKVEETSMPFLYSIKVYDMIYNDTDWVKILVERSYDACNPESPLTLSLVHEKIELKNLLVNACLKATRGY